MMPYPMFQDEQYGYVIVPPGVVPKHAADYEKLRGVIGKVCGHWKCVDDQASAANKISECFNYR